MPIENLVFYFFSMMAILSAIMVIVSKNPVRAVLSLIVTFCSMAALWLLLEAEFLAIILILVYVGAVMVLFLFVVMMLDIELASVRGGFAKFLPLGICVSVLVVLGLVTAVGPEEFGVQKYAVPLAKSSEFSNITVLGELLYTRYLYPFELAGLLLLVAIIASISLIFRGGQFKEQERRDKRQDLRKTALVTKKNRLRLIKMGTGGDVPC